MPPVKLPDDFDVLRQRVDALEIQQSAQAAELQTVGDAQVALAGHVDALETRVAALEPDPPPPPIDCQMSDWQRNSEGPWSTCSPQGQQSRVVRFVRDVLVPPANGGADCGEAEKFETETQACVYVPPPPPPPPSEDDEAYFTALSSHSTKLAYFPLDSQAALDALVADKPSGKLFTDKNGTVYQAGFRYDELRRCAAFRVDPHVNDKDQLKNNIPIGQQLRMLFPPVLPGHDVVIVLDVQFGREFRENFGETIAWKTWGFYSGSKQLGTFMDLLGPGFDANDPMTVSKMTSEISGGMGGGPWNDNTLTGFAGVDGVVYDSYPNGLGRAEGIAAVGFTAGPGAPMQRPFNASRAHYQYHSIRSRIIIRIGVALPPSAFTIWNAGLNVTVQPNPNDPSGEGRWYALTKWVGDAVHGWRCIENHVPFHGWMHNTPARVDCFGAEMNTSKSNPAGPFALDLFRVVMLQDYPWSTPETDPFLFQLPK